MVLTKIDLDNLILDKEYKFYYIAYNDKNEKTIRWKEKYLSNELKNRVLGGK